jgi:CheY-like chemotaxis protein
MHVLIVEENRDLARRWAHHLEADGFNVERLDDAHSAIAVLRRAEPRVIVVNVLLPDGGAFAIADYACYRWPDARAVFITDGLVFADGSVFRHAGNAVACLRPGIPEKDLASLVAYHACSASVDSCAAAV